MSSPRMYLKKPGLWTGYVVVTIAETAPDSEEQRVWLRRAACEERPEKGAHIHQIMTLQEVVEWAAQVTRLANACIEYDRKKEAARKGERK